MKLFGTKLKCPRPEKEVTGRGRATLIVRGWRGWPSRVRARFMLPGQLLILGNRVAAESAEHLDLLCRH